MGKRYKKRKHFRKIELTRNIKMWIILGSALLLLLLVGLITRIDFLFDLLFALIFTAPLLLVRYQFSKENESIGFVVEKNKLQTAFIYAYVIIMFLSIFILPSKKFRWILYFTYFIACGIFLFCKAKKVSLDDISENENFFLLGLTELLMLLLLPNPATTEMNAWGLLLTVIFFIIFSFPLLYFFKRQKKRIESKKMVTYLILLIFMFSFSLRITKGFNEFLDFSQPKVYKTIITEKDDSVSGGSRTRTTHHYFIVNIDGKTTEIEINSDIYEKYEEGSVITVNIHNGALGMTYYIIED